MYLVCNLMYKHLTLFLCLIFVSGMSLSDVSVRGYYRSNGTYVKPHMRSNPDGNFNNNWSTLGNVNPYTGNPGTKIHPNYQTNGSYTYAKNYSTESKSYNKPLVSSSTSNYKNSGYTNSTASYESTGLNLSANKSNNWIFFSKTTNDAMYINNIKTEVYGDGLPVVSIMFTGVIKKNGRLTWLGRRYVKLKVNCSNKNVALIADAVVNSNGRVVKNIVRREDFKFKWVPISKIADQDKFLSTTKICS